MVVPGSVASVAGAAGAATTTRRVRRLPRVGSADPGPVRAGRGRAPAARATTPVVTAAPVVRTQAASPGVEAVAAAGSGSPAGPAARRRQVAGAVATAEGVAVALTGGGGGGSSFVATNAITSSSATSTRTAEGQVTITYEDTTDACPPGLLFISETPGVSEDAATVPAGICFVSVVADGGHGGAGVNATTPSAGGAAVNVSARVSR